MIFRPNIAVALLLAVALPMLAAAPADLEFRGVFSEGDRIFFSIFDRRTESSSWIERGKEVSGFVITSFDPKAELLTLSGPSGKETKLRLVNSSIRVAKPAILSREQAMSEILARLAKPLSLVPVSPEEAAAVGLQSYRSRRLDELSGAEAEQLLRDLAQSQAMPRSASIAGAPVGWVPVTREVLGIELSFNLTDDDMMEINRRMRERADAHIGPLLKKLGEEAKRNAAERR